MSPRELIGAVPFALNAGVAQTVPPSSLNSTHVNFTSGSKNATEALALTSDWQIIPGMQSAITLETDQTVFIFLTVQFLSYDVSGYAEAYIRIVGDTQTYGSNWILMSWPTNDTGSRAYMFDLPAGNYEIQALAKLESGTGTVKNYNTSMSWFAFSQ